jgi:hypothetical protein
MRFDSIASAVLALIILLSLLVQYETLSGLLFASPFVCGSLFVSFVIGMKDLSRIGHCVNLSASILHTAWFFALHVSVLRSSDAQAPIAYRFVTYGSLPIMLPMWAVACSQKNTKRKTKVKKQATV